MHWIVTQFGRPTGLIGRLVGLIMARQNRARIDWAVTLLSVQPTDRILEIGFGPGVALEQIARLATQGLVAGIDHSAIMVAQASKRNAAAITMGRMELRLGSVTALPYAAASFDKVLAINSLHFWPDPVENLRALHQVLRPGGRLVIVSQPRWAKSDADVQAEGERITRQVTAAGFTEITRAWHPMKPSAAVGVIGLKAVEAL